MAITQEEKDLYIKELASVINRKFQSNQDKRNLREVLLLVKMYPLERLVKWMFGRIDLDEIDSMDENASDDNISAIIQNNYFKTDVSTSLKLDKIPDDKFDIIQAMFERIHRVLILNILQNNPQDRKRIISVAKESIADIIYIEGESFDDLPPTLKLDNLPSKYYENAPIEIVTDDVADDTTAELYYFKEIGINKLKELEKILLGNKPNQLIRKNKNFIKSFSKNDDYSKYKTQWNDSQTQLFYLLYLLNGRDENFGGELIPEVAFRLFTVKGNKDNLEITKKNYAKFIKKVSNVAYLESKRQKPITSLYNKLFPTA